MASIFISYSHEDQHWASVVHECLRAEGMPVVIDQDMPAGALWRDWLNAHLRKASVVIVLWSRHSASRDWVRVEAEMARKSSVLLPLIIDDLAADGIPLGFGEHQALVCKWREDGRLSDDTRDKLIESLRFHIGNISPLNAAVEQLRSELEARVGMQYELLESLGNGVLSIVFKVRHRELNEFAAIKVIPLAGILLMPSFSAHFRQGIKAAQRLRHTNVMEVRDLCLEKAIAYTVMEYIEGAPLSQWIGRGPFSMERVKCIAVQLADALAYAHSNDVIHCNLRSSCIFLDARDRPVISDFGMAQIDGNLQNPGTALTGSSGDPRYVSPEQCLGKVPTPRCDQYALGVILFELLTGEPLFDGKSSYVLMRQHCESAPRSVAELRPETPPEVVATVARLLEKQPEKRFLTTRSLLENIKAWPTYESLSGIASRRREPGEAVKIAKRSYERCLADSAEFVELLYGRLLMDPSLNPLLRDLNFDRQVIALQKGIPRLLDFSAGGEGAQAFVLALSEKHRPLGVTGAHFHSFAEALVQLAVELDPEVKGSTEKREILRADWQNALGAGVRALSDLMVSRPPPAVSGFPEAPLVAERRRTMISKV